MSAVETSAEAYGQCDSNEAYRVVDERKAFRFTYGGFIVLDEHAQIVDRFRTESAAQHAAHLLNRGVAYVRPHDVIGCKVAIA